ncbi:hypothetical protein Psta_4435 [Pirellula staleyi DSM 6068]|uniref:Transposase n=1 Tax=Pirellula staleyi (strain ATCC 27377 / DSM 6068 / ICPB 4128) TaxID=530564 RepID=D2R5Z5_PIRSD|nr:hypothetical protein Psta_4435 [Pirellula staleyi DSM 6068]
MTPEYLKSQSFTVRWKVEAYMSGLKRTRGSILQARKNGMPIL